MNDAESKQTELRSSLIKGLQRNHTKAKFLPMHELKRLVNEQRIKAILNDDHLTNWVLANAPKIFAILVLSKKAPDIIPNCKAQGFVDADLPALKESVLTSMGMDDDTRLNFETQQWFFLSPVLTTNNVPARQLPEVHPDAPLPFTSMTRQDGGGFSSIFKCQIHPAHLENPKV